MEVEIGKADFKFKFQGSNLTCPKIPGAYSTVIKDKEIRTLYTVTVVNENKIVITKTDQ